MQDPNTANQEE